MRNLKKSRIILEVNSEIKEKLKAKSIPINDGLAYLVCLYYNIDPSYIPSELKRKVLASGIISKDYSSDTIEWRINLFQETENGFEWISEWMNLFKAVNPERRGIRADVLKRMKKFFANNPSVRKDDIFKATEMYLESVENPKYCKKSHKFIYEIDGSSMLLDYIESIEEREEMKRVYNEDII